MDWKRYVIHVVTSRTMHATDTPTYEWAVVSAAVNARRIPDALRFCIRWMQALKAKDRRQVCWHPALIKWCVCT